MPGGARRKPYRNSQLAVEYLIGHPAASNEDVVKATGCSPKSVTRARGMLVATGQLNRSWFDRQHRPSEGLAGLSPEPTVASPGATGADLPLVGPRDPAALEKALRTDLRPALTDEQMKQRYSAIARYAATTGEFTLEIQSMQALARLNASTGARNRLGPEAPHTREQRRDRVIPILQAAGPSVTAESVILAYDQAHFTEFVDELGKLMSQKGENGVTTQKSVAETRENSTTGDQVPEIRSESVSSGEVGPRDGDDRGQTDQTRGTASGNADGGGDSGQKGS